ncbi:MAG: 30S ribosomal protein S4 [Candidatus Aenigmatarchaeota archaeon]
MGQIKKQKKIYSRPKKPYDTARFQKEDAFMKNFGLRRKKEIWRAESVLRNFRIRAKELLASPNEKKETELFSKLNKMGITVEKLDDILGIRVENILSRRLQSVICTKKIAGTPFEARQLIVHGHVLIDGKRMFYPGLIVTRDMESVIGLDERTKTRLISKEEKTE